MPEIAVLHGVNLDQLGRRDPEQYGTLTLGELEHEIGGFATELGLDVRFFQSNFEGAFVEQLHAVGASTVAGILLNPGAWTHYSYAIRDALELTELPAVEVHLSDVDAREPFRRVSVIADLVIGRVKGHGPDGYREALTILYDHLRGAQPR